MLEPFNSGMQLKVQTRLFVVLVDGTVVPRAAVVRRCQSIHQCSIQDDQEHSMNRIQPARPSTLHLHTYRYQVGKSMTVNSSMME